MISGGGTAGHVYPALAVVKALAAEAGKAAHSLLYVGSAAGLERGIVQAAGLDFRPISVAGGLRGVSPLAALHAIGGLARGLAQALGIVQEFRPDAILATGGYVCAPVVVAGWLRGVPALVYLPDMAPGWTIRFLTPFARRVAVSFPESARFFPASKAVVTGYPVRPEIVTADRAAARRHFGFGNSEKVLLVFGGSRGAHSLNLAVGQALDSLLRLAQVIHVTGEQDLMALETRRVDLPAELRGRYHPYAYLHEEMPLALAAADLAVSRAGASTLGEFPAVGLPAVLVPYAPSSGGHRDQERNADYLVHHGAAVRLDEAALARGMLYTTVSRLLTEERILGEMREQARALAQPGAAYRLAEELLRLAEPPDQSSG